MVESRLGAEAWADGSDGSTAASVEYMELDELWALLSRLSFPLRLKRVLPNICTLSGRSREGMLLDVERPEDFLESVFPSKVCSHAGCSAEVSDRSDDEPDELVWWLRCLSRADARFICWLSSRRLPGDGGPSTAGLRSWSMELALCCTAEDDVTGLTGCAAASFCAWAAANILDLLTAVDPTSLGVFGGFGGFAFFSFSSFSTRYTGMLEAA
jgi:hypothetical protein